MNDDMSSNDDNGAAPFNDDMSSNDDNGAAPFNDDILGLYFMTRADMAKRHHDRLLENAALRMTTQGDADFTDWTREQAMWRKREGIEP